MYTQNLIDKVKKLYPDLPIMHKLALNGDAFLGRYLDDSSSDSLLLNVILKATSLKELQKQAKKEAEKRQLYSEWAKQDPKT